MKGLLKTTKWKIALGGGGVAVVGAVAAVAILLSGQGYRTVAVQEVNGTSIIKNEKQESSNAYEGMHLNSGDDVTVQAESDMTLLLDMDKYVYAEENTHFWLQAEGDREMSKTRIYLEEGSVLNRLNTKLAKGEEYEVDTPNSVMAVRGTVFRVTVFFDSDGIAWTKLEVYDGNVEVSLKTLEDEFNGVSEVFGPGESALIRASSDFSEFVLGEENEVKRSIDYKAIPQATASKLIEFIDDGDVLCIDKELLMDYAKLQEHKIEEVIVEEATCSKEGQREFRCTVCNEIVRRETIPVLDHVTGDWETTSNATCTEKGQRVQLCTVCTEIVRRETIAALGHAPGDWQIISNATCTSEGQSAKICTRCGATVETASIAALGHSFGAWTVTSSASCTSSGSESRTCSRCGSTETSTIAATGHSYGAWTVVNATCTVNGSQSRTCSSCGNTESSVIVATGHDIDANADDSNYELIYDETNTPVMVTVTGTCNVCHEVDVVAEYGVRLDIVDGETVLICEHCGQIIEPQ